MNLRPIISAIAILGSPVAVAQNVAENPKPDPVLDAIQEFKKTDSDSPVETSAITAPESSEVSPSIDKSTETTAPNEQATLEPASSASEEPPTSEPANEPAKPQDMLTVRVEKLYTGKDSIDPSKINLLAPFPAKPMAPTPPGWRLDTSDSAPPFTREVELSPGSKITLSIRPHVLIPDADGVHVFTVSEPGYDNSLGYAQAATVGAILANSIRQLDDDSKQLGNAIDNLQQLLVSLPKPDPQPAAQPAPAVEAAKPLINRKR